MSLPVPRLKKMVELILEENPDFRGIEARNSDIALTIIIWQRWYGVSEEPDGIVHLRRLLDLPREDNIKRVRAVLQNEENKFLPTSWEVAKKRGIERKRWESELGYDMTGEQMARHKQNQAIVPAVSPEAVQTATGSIEQGRLLDIPPKPKPRFNI